MGPRLACITLCDDTADIRREADFVPVNGWPEIAFASCTDALVQMLATA